MDFHVIDEGSGPAILFIHAGVADSRMWRDQIGFDGFRTVAFDKRGYGQTPWVPGPYSDTDDCLRVLDDLEVDNAAIVGCSMGGATALDLAINHSDRVDKLVLVGAYPSGWVPPDGFEEAPLEAEAAAAAEAGDIDRVVEIDYRMWLVGYGRDESSVDPEHAELFFDMDRMPATTESEREEHQTGFGKKHNDSLDQLSVPALVMVGAHDEPILLDAAHYLADRISEHPAVIIPGAAHLPSLEQPDLFNTELRRFLND